MPAVNPSAPLPTPASDTDPAQALRLLEMELARARAQRLARESGAGGRNALRALSVLLLLALLAAGFYVFWRAEEVRGEARRYASPNPAASTSTTTRP